MKILFVSSRGHMGGAENSLLLLMGELRDRHCVSLLCPSGSELARLSDQMGVTCRSLWAGDAKRGFGLGNLLLWAWGNVVVWGVARRERPDVIHANNVYAAALGIVAALGRYAKLVWHVRDCPRRRWLERICGTASTAVIAVSRWIKDDLVISGVEAAKITVVHNGVAMTEGVGSRPSERDLRVFANVGGFVPWKRQTAFLDAASQVADELPDAQFWLVGGDVLGENVAYEAALREHASAGGFEERIVFAGWRKDMAAVWNSIDCLVHTAQTEPFGRALIEAMAAGVPVIAVNAGGPAEILQDGVTGILVAPNDPDALAGAMIRLHNDRAFAEGLAMRARQAVTERFTCGRTAVEVERVYRSLAAGEVQCASPA